MKNLKITLLALAISAPLVGAEAPKKTVFPMENLPAELRQLILQANANSEQVLNIPALAQGIVALSGTSPKLRASINLPQNMLAVLKSLPIAGAIYLAEKLGEMPGIQNEAVQTWLKNIKLENGHALFEAVNANNPENVASILENPNIDINYIDEHFIQNHGRDTALKSATFHGNAEIVRRLLNAGANVNIIKNKNWSSMLFEELTALMIAANYGKADVIKLLIAAGANTNLQTKGGQTALMLASEKGDKEIVMLLLNAGADPDIKNAFKKSAAYFARSNNHPDIATLLDESSEKKRNKQKLK